MPPSKSERCRRKFLRFFPGGFRDETYIDWERGYIIVAAHKGASSLLAHCHARDPPTFAGNFLDLCLGEIVHPF